MTEAGPKRLSLAVHTASSGASEIEAQPRDSAVSWRKPNAHHDGQPIVLRRYFEIAKWIGTFHLGKVG